VEIVIGAANFGKSYGIAQNNNVSPEEVERILDWAEGTINEIDTSEDYQGSQQAISSHSEKFNITSKIDLNKLEKIENLEDRLSKICLELNKVKLDRILLRPHKDLMFTVGALKKLKLLQSGHVVNDFGLTIYDTHELDYYANIVDFPMTFQVPLNLLNRNFQIAIDTNRAICDKATFYVRSIFLQGLLLMKPQEVPFRLKAANDFLRSLNSRLSEMGSSVLEATFAFIKEQEWIGGIVMGISSLEELKTNLHVFQRAKPVDWDFLNHLPIPPPKIWDPRQW